MEGQSGGEWSLVLQTAEAGEIRVGSLIVADVRVYGLFDGWVTSPTVHEGRIAGRNLADTMELSLEYAEGGAPVIPVEILECIGTDTLLVRIDLTEAAEGAYDLSVVTPASGTIFIRPAFYLGTPPVVRVPEDAPTIQEALDAAPPCAEVLVSRDTYTESLVIDKPVRLRCAEPAEGYAYIYAPAPGQRVIHVHAEAGPLAEIEGLGVRHAEITGPGAGIYCEAPAMIRGNYIVGNTTGGAGARGAGIYAEAGARIIGNRIYANDIDYGVLSDDPWSTDPETGGVGGGLFCLDCWVEGNDCGENHALAAGGMVADGVIRGNSVSFNWTAGGPWLEGALRGEITENRFDNCCGSEVPYLLVEGPARLVRNIFTDVIGPLCYYSNDIYLKGSMEVVENIFGDVGIKACLRTDAVDEPEPGHFRMMRNYLHAWEYSEVNLYLDSDVGICRTGLSEPQEEIPPDSIDFACNIAYWVQFTYHRTTGSYPCTDCAYTLDELPMGCPDTIPDFEYGCEPWPVLLQSYGIEPTAEGIRLFWSVPADVRVDGFDVEREYAGRSERLTQERLRFCHTCEYIDTQPPDVPPVLYRLLIYAGGEEPTPVILGVWDGVVPAQPRIGLSLPSPHPIRANATLRFTLPASGGTVHLELLDSQGRSVAKIVEGDYPSGTHSILWDGRDDRGKPLASGIYVLRLSSTAGRWNRKVLLLR
jgi:hypothetical protein